MPRDVQAKNPPRTNVGGMGPATDSLFVRARRKAADGFRWPWRRVTWVWRRALWGWKQVKRPFAWAREVGRRLWTSRKKWGPPTLFAVLGVAAVVASLLPNPGLDDAWTRDLLLTIGSSLALFAPLYFITRTLDTHLGEVATEAQETKDQVAEVRVEAAATQTALTESVEALRADVDRKLNDFARQVSQDLEAEAAADTAAFASLRTDEPTRETVIEALRRADSQRLTTLSRPPRVDVSDRNTVYLSAQFDAGEWASVPLMLRLEDVAGEVSDWIEWTAERSARDVFVEVGQAFRRKTGEMFDPARFLTGLADLLDAASSSRERRPAVELCAPQWMVCEWGVVTYGPEPPYAHGLTVKHLRVARSREDIAEKTWADTDSFNAAREVSLALFPDRGNEHRIFDDYDKNGKKTSPF